MRILLITFIAIFAVPAMSAQLNSACHIVAQANARVEGTNYLAKYEIASVSKVMTSQWAVQVLKAEYRYKTQIHVVPVSSDVVDIHLSGGQDPYFNAWQFQYMVSQLNLKGVTKVRTLSFDENFKFKIENRDPKTSSVTDWKPGEPSPKFILSQLQKMLKNLQLNYPGFRSRVKTAENISLPSKLVLSAKEVKFTPSNEYGGTSQAKSFVMESLPLHELLKEMNRNSNNYAANIIFEHLGGAKAYADFVKATLKLGPDSIEFINGSGDSLVGPDQKNMYNRASCAAVLTVVGHLYVDLKNQGKRIEDVLAVAGNNSGMDSPNTLSTYSNEQTRNAVAAKTGTVCPAIALAGTFHSQKGLVFFAYLYRTKWCNNADANSARSAIRTDLIKVIGNYGGPNRVKYQTPIYSQIDSHSALQDVTEIQMR